MKSPAGFDARRLRPSKPRSRRWRLGAALSALSATLGILLAMAGAATLLGRPPDLGGLNDYSVESAIFLLVLGLLLLWVSILAWRLCRRRLRRPSEGLSLSPHLMKKRN